MPTDDNSALHRPLLVTGVTGLLGANFAVVAAAAGTRVIGVTHRYPFQADGIETCRADLRNRDVVLHLARDTRPSWMVHCAAMADVDRCETEPEAAWADNCDAARWVAEAAQSVGARLLHVSTDGIFSGIRGGYCEDDLPKPVNVYARTKLAAEEAVLQYSGALVVRTTIYGYNAQPKHSLGEWVLAKLQAGEIVPGLRDVVFTPILVNHLAELMLAMMARKLSGVYHVAGAEALSKYEFARRIAAIFGYDPDLVRATSLRSIGLRAQRPLDTSLKTEKVVHALGRPMPDVDCGLRHFRELSEQGWPARLRRLAGVSDVHC